MLPVQGAWVQSLVGELRSQIPSKVTKKKKSSQHAEGCLCVLIPLPLKQVKEEGGGEAGGSFRDRREGTGGPVFALCSQKLDHQGLKWPKSLSKDV